jgi:nucleoside-diphosphate-sugar epimerase
MSKTIKVLVTGAGGFLGTYIVRDLLAENKYEVTSFSRRTYSHLEQMGIKQISGNLCSYEDVQLACQNIDVVIHTASLVGMWGKYEDFYETNVIGTRNIIKACLQHKIKKCIYTSTPSVVFGEESLLGVDETAPYPKKYLSFYAETKSIAEQDILNAHSSEFKTVALRPHLIFGPGDLNLVPRVIEAAKQGQLKIVGKGNNLVDVTYVENVSAIHVLAIDLLNEHGPIGGKAYFVGQGPIKLWDFTNELLKRSGIKPITKKVPFILAYYIGYIIETVFKLFNIYNVEPKMTRFIALQLGKSHYYNHSNLKKDFNFQMKYSIEDGLNKLFNN